MREQRAYLFSQLKIGMRVSLRWVPPAPPHLSKNGKRTWGQRKFRWIRCYVHGINEESGRVEVREKHAKRWLHPTLSASELWNSLVIGW